MKKRFTLKHKDRQKKENNDEGYNPTRITEPEPKVEKNIESGYNPSSRKDPPQQEKFSINLTDKSNEPVSNPYAPKEPASNPYAPKEPASNPYAPAPKEEVPVVNPYAPKEDAPKRER